MRATGGAPTSVPPSNRRGTGSKSEPWASEPPGLDRVSLSFPLRSFEPDETAWDTSLTTLPGTEGAARTLGGSVYLGEGEDRVKVFVGVKEVPEHAGIRFWGKAEFNPSRVVDPGGYGLAPVSAFRPTVQLVAVAVEQLLAPEDRDSESWSVKRLDVARDFEGVDQVPVVIRALAPLHRPHARLNLVHSDSTRNGAQTLLVGSRTAGSTRLYDKHQETDGAAPVGSLRFEAECKPGWLSNYGGIKKVRDVTEQSAGMLAQNRWDWSQMGAEVAGDLGQLVERVAASGLSNRQQIGFLGWLVMQAAGSGAPVAAKEASAKYRRIQRDLGIAAPTELVTTGAVVRRLDWDTGREVLRVA
jgi:hypothetical protein